MRNITKILKILLLASVFVFAFSYFAKKTLPSSSEIDHSLINSPVQEKIEISPFSVQKGGITYKITPLYSYSISGLVVADYDSENWLDYAHRNDHLNTKDLCLLWNNNLKNDTFKLLNYSHGEFTCYIKYSGKNYEAVRKSFDMSQLSNNHLIPKNDLIYQKIKSSGIGDQVRIKGYLANYSYTPEGSSQPWARNTSLVIGDTGNGACEIIYVTDFEIIKRANVIWRALF